MEGSGTLQLLRDATLSKDAVKGVAVKHILFLLHLLLILLSQGCQSPGHARADSIQAAMDPIADVRDRGNLSDALGMSFAAEERFGPDPLLFCQRSSMYESLGKTESAITEAKKAIPLWPGGYLYTARLYGRLGNAKKAVALLDEALADKRVQADTKTVAEVRYHLAKAFSEMGEGKKAIAECDAALLIVPPLHVTLRSQIEGLRDQVLKANSAP